MLEWRTRDNRYEGCSAFIDTAEVNRRSVLVPALGRLLRGQPFLHVISLLTPPSACRSAAIMMHSPKQRTCKLSDYVCVLLDIPRPSCLDETTCRPCSFSLTQAQSSVPVTYRRDICSLTDAPRPVYSSVSGVTRILSLKLNSRRGLFRQLIRLDKGLREQRAFQSPIKNVRRHSYDPNAQCHPLLFHPKCPLSLWTSYSHSFHCPLSQPPCKPASFSTQ